MRPDSDNRRMVGHHAMLLEMGQDHLLYLGFTYWSFLANLIGDEAERDIISRTRVLGCFEMEDPLLIVPAGLETLNQVARRHDVDAEGAHQLDGAGIDARDIRIGVAWHVFHGDTLDAFDEGLHAGFEFLPTQIDPLRSRHVIERRRFNAVN